MSSRTTLPLPAKRGLKKLGQDIAAARRRRRLTMQMMAERAGVSRVTYARVEAGDPTVSMGTYAATLFVLGIDTPFAELADPSADNRGLLMEMTALPKRVRPRRRPKPL
jgi:transcriptional regulator with XRE-family HTH domain